MRIELTNEIIEASVVDEAYKNRLYISTEDFEPQESEDKTE